jgi:hypothetical protein
MFMLAERLGMTVAELGGRMSGEEMTEWMAFDMHNNEERERARLAARSHADAKRLRTRRAR